MNVVVTGGAGYVGSVLVRKLVARGHSVRVVDEFADGEASLEGVLDRIEIVQAPLQALQPRWFRDVDGVAHLAGLGEARAHGADLEANWLAHAVTTERLALACRALKVPRLTFASTWEVYWSLPAGYEYDEATPVRPRSAFAASKFFAERRLQQLADGAFCPVILRHAVPFGLSPRACFDSVLNRLVLEAVGTGRVSLPRDGWMACPIVDVDDLAEAHVRCLEAPASTVRGAVFNVLGANLRIRDAACLVAEIVGQQRGPIRVTQTDAPVGMGNARCCGARLEAALGFTPQRSIEAAIQEMARYLTRNADAADTPMGRALHGSGAPDRGDPSGGRSVDGMSGTYRCSVQPAAEAREGWSLPVFGYPARPEPPLWDGWSA
jgi:nucleoside-diphosphate-sugar epimerase